MTRAEKIMLSEVKLANLKRETGISKMVAAEKGPFSQDAYGRLHNNITNLKSEYRNYLTTDTGSKLVSIDIKNSQPFFSTRLLNKSFWDGTGDFVTIQNIKPKVRNTLQQHNTINNLIMFTKSVEDNEDVKMYIDMVLRGCLYEFLGPFFHFDEDSYPDRKHTKECVFQIFFSPEQYLKESKAAMFFQALFPSVYELFAQIKKHEHNVLAILLQSIESEVVIEGVVKEFFANNEDAAALTIHDSVLVDVNRAPTMKCLMESCIERMVGYKPTLSYEILKSEAP